MTKAWHPDPHGPQTTQGHKACQQDSEVFEWHAMFAVAAAVAFAFAATTAACAVAAGTSVSASCILRPDPVKLVRRYNACLCQDNCQQLPLNSLLFFGDFLFIFHIC